MWTSYLQLRGAEARAAGRSRDDHQLDSQDAALWLEGYDAMNQRITSLLGEIRRGWLVPHVVFVQRERPSVPVVITPIRGLSE